MTHSSDDSFDADYWDRIWDGARGGAMALAPPNPHLVREIADLEPGTALEAGCGAGAEASWLAARGWQVTAVDIAAEALATAAQRAADAGVIDRVQWVQADLSAWEPETRFDLVTTHYAHPATPQLDFYERIAGWVAPGGTLLIVGHLHPDHHGADSHHHGHGESGPPAKATANAAGITGLLDPTAWEIRTALETRRSLPGPEGQEVTLHDVVVRATRR